MPSEDLGFKINEVSEDADSLVERTFNSSYNEKQTNGIRLKFSSLFHGKDKIETFLFFTDPHLTMRSRYETITDFIVSKHISTLQKYYNSLPLDYCICGGDIINSCDSYSQACEALSYADSYMRKLFKNYYFMQGNHDDNPYDWGGTGSRHMLTQTEMNNLVFRDTGSEYYSFDGKNTKFYVLNSGHSKAYEPEDVMNEYKWMQIDWLAHQLIQDNPAHAILMNHMNTGVMIEIVRELAVAFNKH